MKRWEGTLHGIDHKWIEYEIPQAIKTPKIVDDSNFIPESEILKKLDGTRNLTNGELEVFYDFPDGKDTGIKVPFERSTANVDMAVLAKDIQNKQMEIKDIIGEAAETQKRKAAREAAVEKTLTGGTTEN